MGKSPKISPPSTSHLVSDLKEMYAKGQITLAPGNTIKDPECGPVSTEDDLQEAKGLHEDR